MAAKDLFELGVRLIGVLSVVLGLPSVLLLDYGAAAQIVAGLILITRADVIGNFCYPPPRVDYRDL